MTESIDPILKEITEELDKQAVEPPRIGGAPDQAIGQFSAALSEHIRENPETQEMIVSSVENNRRRRPFPSIYAVNFIFRLCQMQWMDRPSYPFSRPADWRDNLDKLLADSAKRSEIHDFMLFWNVGSDIETRIAGLKLVAHILQTDRTTDPEDPYTVLNVGASRNHGLAMLAGNIPFPNVVAEEPSNAHIDPATTTCVNELLDRPITLGECYGVDVWPLRDPVYSRFLQACRFYPSELHDTYKRNLYQSLEDIREQSPNIHHSVVDFGELDKTRPQPMNNHLQGLGPSNTYDAVLFSTCLYQNFPEKQRAMLENGLARLRRYGKLIVQDFCAIRPVDPDVSHIADQLIFHEGWYSRPHGYMTAVYDAAEPEKGLQPFCTWNNSRCEQLRPAGLMMHNLARVCR